MLCHWFYTKISKTPLICEQVHKKLSNKIQGVIVARLKLALNFVRVKGYKSSKRSCTVIILSGPWSIQVRYEKICNVSDVAHCHIISHVVLPLMCGGKWDNAYVTVKRPEAPLSGVDNLSSDTLSSRSYTFMGFGISFDVEESFNLIRWAHLPRLPLSFSTDLSGGAHVYYKVCPKQAQLTSGLTPSNCQQTI